MLSPDDIFPFGSYQLAKVKVKDVPKDYFDFIVKEKKISSFPEVVKYYRNNVESKNINSAALIVKQATAKPTTKKRVINKRDTKSVKDISPPDFVEKEEEKPSGLSIVIAVTCSSRHNELVYLSHVLDSYDFPFKTVVYYNGEHTPLFSFDFVIKARSNPGHQKGESEGINSCCGVAASLAADVVLKVGADTLWFDPVKLLTKIEEFHDSSYLLWGFLRSSRTIETDTFLIKPVLAMKEGILPFYPRTGICEASFFSAFNDYSIDVLEGQRDRYYSTDWRFCGYHDPSKNIKFMRDNGFPDLADTLQASATHLSAFKLQ